MFTTRERINPAMLAPVLTVKHPRLNCFLIFGVMSFFCRAVVSWGAAPGSEEMSFKVTANEAATAKSVAERALAEKKLAPAYFIKAEVTRDKTAEAEARRILVTHYQIAGDLTILTTVNLAKNAAESVETIAHLPTPLSEEEFKQARELGLAEPKVKEALGKDIEKITVEPLVLRTMAKNDPIFGHRVVRLLFRIDKNYLSKPIVTVDLTARKVTVMDAIRQ